MTATCNCTHSACVMCISVYSISVIVITKIECTQKTLLCFYLETICSDDFKTHCYVLVFEYRNIVPRIAVMKSHLIYSRI